MLALQLICLTAVALADSQCSDDAALLQVLRAEDHHQHMQEPILPQSLRESCSLCEPDWTLWDLECFTPVFFKLTLYSAGVYQFKNASSGEAIYIVQSQTDCPSTLTCANFTAYPSNTTVVDFISLSTGWTLLTSEYYDTAEINPFTCPDQFSLTVDVNNAGDYSAYQVAQVQINVQTSSAAGAANNGFKKAAEISGQISKGLGLYKSLAQFNTVFGSFSAFFGLASAIMSFFVSDPTTQYLQAISEQIVALSQQIQANTEEIKLEIQYVDMQRALTDVIKPVWSVYAIYRGFVQSPTGYRAQMITNCLSGDLTTSLYYLGQLFGTDDGQIVYQYPYEQWAKAASYNATRYAAEVYNRVVYTVSTAVQLISVCTTLIADYGLNGNGGTGITLADYNTKMNYVSGLVFSALNHSSQPGFWSIPVENIAGLSDYVSEFAGNLNSMSAADYETMLRSNLGTRYPWAEWDVYALPGGWGKTEPSNCVSSKSLTAADYKTDGCNGVLRGKSAPDFPASEIHISDANYTDNWFAGGSVVRGTSGSTVVLWNQNGMKQSAALEDWVAKVYSYAQKVSLQVMVYGDTLNFVYNSLQASIPENCTLAFAGALYLSTTTGPPIGPFHQGYCVYYIDFCSNPNSHMKAMLSATHNTSLATHVQRAQGASSFIVGGMMNFFCTDDS